MHGQVDIDDGDDDEEENRLSEDLIYMGTKSSMWHKYCELD